MHKMQFNFFGRTFYFFAEQRQFLKSLNILETYFIKPVVLALIIILVIYFELRMGAFLFKKEKLKSVLRKMSPWIYLLVILTLTVFNRQSGERTFRLFESWIAGEENYHESTIIDNVFNLLFYIPYGFLLYKWGKYEKKYLKVVGIVLITSVLTEMLQFALAKGVCSVGDVLMNLAGGIIGATFAVIFTRKKSI